MIKRKCRGCVVYPNNYIFAGEEKMKHILTIVLVLVISMSLCACGGAKKEEEASKEPQKVELTSSNIEDYLTFKANFINGRYENLLGIMNYAKADMEVEAYSTVAGTYDNVEVTLKANMTEQDNYSLIDQWHLEDTEDNEIKITFKMPSSGEYEATYPVECTGSTQRLNGIRDFTVISASGTFIPAN